MNDGTPPPMPPERWRTLASTLRREFPSTPGLLLPGEGLVRGLESGRSLEAAPSAMLWQLLAPRVWSAAWLFLLDEADLGFSARAGEPTVREALMRCREAFRLLAHPNAPGADSDVFRSRMAAGAEQAASSEENPLPPTLLAGGFEVWSDFLPDFRLRAEQSRAFAAEVFRFEGAAILGAEGPAGDASENYGLRSRAKR